MKQSDDLIAMRVADVELLSPSLKRFRLVPLGGELLVPVGAGAHLQVSMREGERVYKNAYSLVSTPGERRHYEIVVRRVVDSRGGSAFMHDAVSVGTLLHVSAPRNLFPIHRTAPKHLLIAGGIGITPFLSYLDELTRIGATHELHFCSREEEVQCFDGWFEGRDTVAIYTETPGNQLDFDELLSTQLVGTHLYVCGPGPMMDAVLHIAESKGWAPSTLHSERFGAGIVGEGRPFTARLERTGVDIHVPANTSLLDAIEAAGIEAPCLCRGGACGQCRTTVIEGDIDHRDHFLSASEKAAGEQIMLCVSRACNERIVLDL
ncbi:Ferredoxin-NADP reductase [Burkholderia sp. GAS332]|nr:Ferredoxin-NADP reductase [Burkholderia sp. GAS332]